MRLIAIAAAIYTALVGSAIALDVSALTEMREGDMRKLRFHTEAKEVPDVPITLADGSQGNLDIYKGKIVVLNFWATWCAPCRKEMPELSALQADLGGEDFDVVTLATGRNEPNDIARFLMETEITNLPMHRDPKQKLARALGVFGLPVTLILDRDGNEIARMQGEANWHSDNAVDIIKAIING